MYHCKLLQEFKGNYNRDHIVTNIFPDVLVSRCLRVVPLIRHGNHTALRLELLGCGMFNTQTER